MIKSYFNSSALWADELLLLYIYFITLFSVADLEGVQEVRSNPPPDPNYLIFMGNLRDFV